MASTISKEILVKTVGADFVQEEAAAGVITPGDFLERTTDGKYQRKSTAGQEAPKLVANFAGYIGKTLDDDYQPDERVLALSVRSGDWVNAFVPASAPAIVIGDNLYFDDTGCVLKVDSGQAVVATAVQAVDNSAGSSKARLIIEMG